MWTHRGFFFSDSSYVQFFGDDFLRTLILRFVFCDVTLRLHRGFRGRHQRPRCEPPLPSAELLEHPSLAHIILQLASALDVRGHFVEGPEGDWWRKSWDRKVIDESSRTRRELSRDVLLLTLLLLMAGARQLRGDLSGKHETSNACRSVACSRIVFKLFKHVISEATDGGGDRMQCCHELQCYTRTLFMIWA